MTTTQRETKAPVCISCGAPATWVTEWQTPTMPAPAVWHDCDKHLSRTKESTKLSPHIQFTTRKLP